MKRFSNGKDFFRSVPRERILEIIGIAHGREFLLDRFVYRHAAVLALLPYLPFLFAGRIYTVFSRSLLGSAERTEDIAGGLFELFKPHERLGVNGYEEMAEMVRYLFAVLYAGKHFKIIALLERGGQYFDHGCISVAFIARKLFAYAA